MKNETSIIIILLLFLSFTFSVNASIKQASILESVLLTNTHAGNSNIIKDNGRYLYNSLSMDIMTYLSATQLITDDSPNYNSLTSMKYSYYFPTTIPTYSNSDPTSALNRPLVVDQCYINCDVDNTNNQQNWYAYGFICKNYDKINGQCLDKNTHPYYSTNVYQQCQNYVPRCSSENNTHTIEVMCAIKTNPYYFDESQARSPSTLNYYQILQTYSDTNPSSYRTPWKVLNPVQVPLNCSYSGNPSTADQTCWMKTTFDFTFGNFNNCSEFVKNGQHYINLSNLIQYPTNPYLIGGYTISRGSPVDLSGRTSNTPLTIDQLISFADPTSPLYGSSDIFLAKQLTIQLERENWKETLGIINAILSIQEIIYNLIVLLYYIFELIALIYFFTALIPGIFVTIINLFKKATTLPNEVNQNE